MSDTWTIGELAERAADLLRADAQRSNGRVREVPGERLIRWYTTIGLVDPPLSRRGRVARYGRRHLLQLVAVKRLQAAGRSIADIQVALAGATDVTLEKAARPGGGPARFADALGPDDVPRETTHDGDGPRAHAHTGTAPKDTRGQGVGMGAEASSGKFWARRPSEAAPGRDPSGRDPSGDGPRRHEPSGHPALVSGVRLAPGVVLVFDGGGRALSTDDVQAVLAAAGPLLAVLEERKLP